jgi:hypothetical protein
MLLKHHTAVWDECGVEIDKGSDLAPKTHTHAVTPARSHFYPVRLLNKVCGSGSDQIAVSMKTVGLRVYSHEATPTQWSSLRPAATRLSSYRN